MLEQALADSPAFVSAALSLYALTGTVPEATVSALQDDGPGLWALAAGVRKLGAGGGARRRARADGRRRSSGWCAPGSIGPSS